jgi:hypothetical protein
MDMSPADWPAGGVPSAGPASRSRSLFGPRLRRVDNRLEPAVGKDGSTGEQCSAVGGAVGAAEKVTLGTQPLLHAFCVNLCSYVMLEHMMFHKVTEMCTHIKQGY